MSDDPGISLCFDGLLFTPNRDFRSEPKILARAKGMYYCQHGLSGGKPAHRKHHQYADRRRPARGVVGRDDSRTDRAPVPSLAPVRSR